MSLTDKTRKMLWGRSGNRCAICKHELVVDATKCDDESVVGDECHIISPRSNGPRRDPCYPARDLDAYGNLILLCRVHHKMVDDQSETYTVDILRNMKANHEVWVSQKLTDTPEWPKPGTVKVRRIKQNIPAYLIHLTTGKEVLNLVLSSYGSLMDHDELKSDEEVDLVGSFLQTLQDLSDMGEDLEPSDRVKAAYGLTLSLQELEEAGFFVFGGREVQLLEGGIGGPSDFPILILKVVRKDNAAVIHMNLDGAKDETVQKTSPGRKQ